MSPGPGPSRVSRGVPTGGQFAASAHAESAVALSDAAPSREDLLDAPELRDLPADWLAPKSDQELADWLAYARERKTAHAADQAQVEEDRAAETARRRAYRRPSWLVKDGDTYSTDDGYRASKVTDVGDGRARTSYVVHAPDGTQGDAQRVEEVAQWIERHRASAQSPAQPPAQPPAVPDWRDQAVSVEGRAFTFADVYGGRLFHGSPHPIDDGGLIAPGRAEANFAQSDADTVSVTSGADIAKYWADQAASGAPVYVYEIEPAEGPIDVWRAGLAAYGKQWRLAEGRVPSARVLRRIDLDDAAHYERALNRGTDPLARTEETTR